MNLSYDNHIDTVPRKVSQKYHSNQTDNLSDEMS